MGPSEIRLRDLLQKAPNMQEVEFRFAGRCGFLILVDYRTNLEGDGRRLPARKIGQNVAGPGVLAPEKARPARNRRGNLAGPTVANSTIAGPVVLALPQRRVAALLLSPCPPSDTSEGGARCEAVGGMERSGRLQGERCSRSEANLESRPEARPEASSDASHETGPKASQEASL